VDALSRALGRGDAGDVMEATPGALVELVRLAEAEVGLLARAGEPWSALHDRLAQYLFVSELAADLPGGLPAALAGLPHADGLHQERALEICDRLRDSEAGREAYVRMANNAEQALRLSSQLRPESELGTRDTFMQQERLRLAGFVRSAVQGDLVAASALLKHGEGSVWRRDAERALLWQVAQRCLSFLDAAAAHQKESTPKHLGAFVDLYTAADGLWRLDRAQRLFEQAGAYCAEDDEVEALLQACRARYRDVVTPAQTAFQSVVRVEGWPPEGVRRQTQTFDTHVAPELSERRKTAYFLVDSLRYEM
jgi:hypothetical protein